MEYWAIVREAWDSTRRNRGLWGFGAITATQAVMTMIMAMVVGFLFAASMMLIEILAIAGSTGDDTVSSNLADVMSLVERFISANGGMIIAAAAGLSLLWIGVAVLDVASLGGLVAESDAAGRGGSASFSRGLASGWRLWWRVAGLYAIQALPSLVTMAAMALLMWVPLLGPTLSGGSPVPGQAMAASQLIQPLASLSSLIAIPLSVVVLFALRFAVIEDMDWRSAFSASWNLVKANAGTVALFFLVIWGVGIVGGMAMGAIVIVAAVLQLVALFMAIAPATVIPGIVIAVLVTLIELAGFFVVIAAMVVVTANAYTIAWRQLVARPVAEKPVPVSPPLSPAPAPAPFDGVPPASPVYEGKSS